MPPAPPNGRTFDGPMIPAGTPLHVRLDESLGTRHDRGGERFYATLGRADSGRWLEPCCPPARNSLDI